MIEKLETDWKEAHIRKINRLENKVNEIIDVVNKIQSRQSDGKLTIKKKLR